MDTVDYKTNTNAHWPSMFLCIPTGISIFSRTNIHQNTHVHIALHKETATTISKFE